MKIAFLHPDLGIGGAERLVVDAALGLQNRGHDVTIYTSHLDKSHCFEEVKSGLLRAEVRGDFLPINIKGKFSIVCAALRQFYLILDLIRSKSDYDVFVIDQLSYGIPLIRQYLGDARIMFYCHFPDQLLSARESIIKRVYRLPFDWYEQWTTDMSDVIVVNSKFTRSVFEMAFPGIQRSPDVIYPCVDVDQKEKFEKEPVHPLIKNLKTPFFLSVNRFERKKNIDLALEAFLKLCDDSLPENFQVKLVIAGGYDPRVSENVQCLKELVDIAAKTKLVAKVYHGDDLQPVPSFDGIDVILLPSISTQLRTQLMAHAELLLYTPSYEHFGIVPLEAMLLETPVLATNTGGPLETVIDSQTGFSRPANPHHWYVVMHHVLFNMTPQEKLALGRQCSEQVIEKFSPEKMATEFEQKIKKSLKVKSRPECHIQLFFYAILAIFIAFMALVVMI